MPQQRRFSGWALTRLAVVVLGLLFAIRFVITPGAEESIRAVVRLTAQTSVVLFSFVFAASSLRVVWRSEFSGWLLRNRRYLGVAFAFSHAIHLIALIALARVSAEFAASVSPVTLIFGGLGFAFIAALAATSNDRAVRSMGLPNWRRLHKTGVYYLWFIFFQSYLPRALSSPVYWIPTGLLLVALGLRIYAWQRSRARVAAPA